MVTVIVPVYNTEKYLHQCVGSILSQSYNDIEVLLIDDGSSDKSGDLCDFWGDIDKRVRVIHQHNIGLPLSRYVGINNANGEFIAFVDSDDWLEPNYIQILMEAFDDDTVDLSIGGFVRDAAESKNVDLKVDIISKKQALEHLLKADFFPWTAWGKIYRRSVVTNLPKWWYIEGRTEDLEFNWKVLQRVNRVSVCNITGYHYCCREDSMMHTRLLPGYKVTFERLNHIIQECKPIRETLHQYGMERALLVLLPLFFDGIKKRWLPVDIALEHQSFFVKWKERLYDKSSVSRLKSYHILDHSIFDIQNHYDFNRLKNEVQEFSKYCSDIYIYGAGKIAKEFAIFLENNGIKYKGFVVSKKKTDDISLDIIELSEFLNNSSSSGVMLALNESNEIEVKRQLQKVGFTLYISVGKYFL